MYTAPIPNAFPIGPHLFLCLGCDTGSDETTCACGWSTCDCAGCRQSLRLERYDRWTFDYQSMRGLLAVGCAGGSRPPEKAPAPVEEPVVIAPPIVEAPSAEPVAPAAPPVPPTKTGTATFRAMVRLCGLSHAEAAEVLNLSESAVKKKSAGSLGITSDDLLHLQAIWGKVVRGELEGLPAGAVEASSALRTLQD